MSVTYLKGPLGWVVLEYGKPIGRISKTHGRFLVSIDGFRPGVDPATRGTHTFETLGAAKAQVARIVGRARIPDIAQSASTT